MTPSPSRRRAAVLFTLAIVLTVVGVGAAFLVVSDGDDGGGKGGDGRRGGVLRVAAVDLRSLDPAQAREPVEMMLADQLFDTLLTYDAGSLAVRPGLSRLPEVSDDQRRFTFRLRESARFHDGSPVTALDVKTTLERIAAPGSKSDFRFLLEKVTGYAPFHVDAAASDLAGVTTPDERTVVVELDEPFAEFPAVLGNPGFGVVPGGGAGLGTGEPVGSGPLSFVGDDGGVVRLRRFRGHRPPANVEAVEVVRFRSTQEAYDALERGEVDLAPVPADRVGDAAEQFGDAGLGPFTGVLFYGMNLSVEEFADPRMRAAVLHAVDRERIVDVAYGDTVILAEGFVPEGIPGTVADACGARCEHSRDEARRLLREAFPGGGVPEIAIDFDADPVQKTVAKAIRADLKAVGIPAVLRPHEFADYGPFLVRDAPELFRLGWTADYPSPDAFLYPLFVSEEDDNLTRLDVPEVDDLLRRARAEPDRARRVELYREAEQRVLDEVPVVPIAQFTNRWAVGPDVEDFVMTPLGTFDVTTAYLDR